MKQDKLTEEKAENSKIGGVLIGKRQGQTIIHDKGTLSGYLVGKTHAEGGIKAINKSTGQPLEMQGGEVVITAPAVADQTKREFEGQMLTNREILSKINEEGGGVSFAKGGDIPNELYYNGKSYNYGGKMMTDYEIMQSINDCSCNNNFADGGLLAPNGKPSNLTAEQYKLVRTPEFKAWFGDWENDPENASKVVDENGEPMVVYHTTSAEFNIFSKKKSKEGFFFAPQKERLSVYNKSNINSYFLNLRNPSHEMFKSDLNYLIPKGYDGIMDYGHAKHLGNKNLYEIIAFEPNQIKLADGTNTTFNKNNNDIRFDYGGGLSKGKSIEDIASMHKVTISHINSQLQKGIEVESEHTSDKKLAEKIAKDHLVENPNYYTILDKVGLSDGGEIERALDDLEKARSVKGYMQPEFNSETYDYPKQGKANSYVKKVDDNSKTILAYDNNGEIVGLFSISTNVNEEGAFKIVVREDSINKGWGKKLLDEAEKQNIDIVGNIKNNSFTSSGRYLLRSWLTSKNKFNSGGSLENFKYSKEFSGITIYTDIEQEYFGNNYSPFESKGSFKATIRKNDLENIALESKDLVNYNFIYGVDDWNTISKKLKDKKITKLELYKVGKTKTFELKPIIEEYKKGGQLNLVKDSKKGDHPSRDLNNYNDLMDIQADGEVGGETGLELTDGVGGADASGGVGAFDNGGQVSVETILFGVRIGEPDWKEVLITNNPDKIEDAKKWALANGFDRLRVSKIDIMEKPDFTKTFDDGGDIGCYADGGATLSAIVFEWDKVPTNYRNITKVKKVPFTNNPMDKGLDSIISPFLGKDELKPVMTGINFDDNGITATNAHILITLPYPNKKYDGVYDVNKAKKTKSDEVLLINEKYPNYEAVIPKSENVGISYLIDVYKLLQYTKTALNYTNKVTYAIAFKYGEDERIGFNGKFLTQVLTTALKLGHEKLYAFITAPNRAMVLSPNKNYELGNDELLLTMPVMLTSAYETITGYGTSDSDYNRSLKVYFDFNDSEIHNADGSVAEFKMQYENNLSVDDNYLSLLSKITRKYYDLPILNYVKVENGKMTATDLDISLIVKDVNMPDGIYEIVNKAPNITMNPIEDFPKLPIFKSNEVVVYHNGSKPTAFEFVTFSEVFEFYLDKLLLSVGKDNLRPVMSGICIKKTSENEIFLVTTNAHTLCKINITEYCEFDKDDRELEYILPVKYLKDFVKLADGSLHFKCSKANIFIESDNLEYIGRAIDGKYPNYDAVIPRDNTKKIVFDHVAMNKCLKSPEVANQGAKYKGDKDIVFTLSNEGNNLFLKVQKDKGYNAPFEFIDKIQLCEIDFNYEQVDTNISLDKSVFLLMPFKDEFKENQYFAFRKDFFEVMLNTITDTEVECYFSEPNRAYIFPIDAIDYKKTLPEEKTKQQKLSKAEIKQIIELEEMKDVLEPMVDDKSIETNEFEEIIDLGNNFEIRVEKVFYESGDSTYGASLYYKNYLFKYFVFLSNTSKKEAIDNVYKYLKTLRVSDKILENAPKKGEFTVFYNDTGGEHRRIEDSKAEIEQFIKAVNSITNKPIETNEFDVSKIKLKGVTTIFTEDNGKTLIYGTKNNQTRISVLNLKTSEIKEELDFEKQIYEKTKKDIYEFNESEIKNSYAFSTKEKLDIIKLHNQSILKNEERKKLIIPFLESHLKDSQPTETNELQEAIETLEILFESSKGKDKKEIKEALEILKMLNEN